MILFYMIGLFVFIFGSLGALIYLLRKMDV